MDSEKPYFKKHLSFTHTSLIQIELLEDILINAKERSTKQKTLGKIHQSQKLKLLIESVILI